MPAVRWTTTAPKLLTNAYRLARLQALWNPPDAARLGHALGLTRPSISAESSPSHGVPVCLPQASEVSLCQQIGHISSCLRRKHSDG
jgi:hypothetical protein